MHDIRLFDRGQPAVPLARQIHADAADAFDLRRRVGVGVETAA